MQRDVVEAVLHQGLRNLATSVPVLSVYIVGIAMALVTWRRAPRACLLALLGVIALLLTACGAAFLWPAVSSWGGTRAVESRRL
jgi:CHASE2 domain-containing sensor protein